jgi:hypothetical protein
MVGGTCSLIDSVLPAGTATGPAAEHVVATSSMLQLSSVLTRLTARRTARVALVPGAAVKRTLRSRATRFWSGERMLTLASDPVTAAACALLSGDRLSRGCAELHNRPSRTPLGWFGAELTCA